MRERKNKLRAQGCQVQLKMSVEFIGLGGGVEDDVKIGYFLIFLSQ